MVSVNLVPQQKQDKQKDIRTKSLILTLIVVINGGLLGVMIVLFFVTQAQHFAIGRVQSGINNKHSQITEIDKVQDMLTLQRNLKALPGAYRQRVAISQFFAVLEKVSPGSVSVSSLSASASGELEVTGQAPSYLLVSTLAEAMKRETGKFEKVSLSSAAGENDTVSFTLTATAIPLVTGEEQ